MLQLQRCGFRIASFSSFIARRSQCEGQAVSSPRIRERLWDRLRRAMNPGRERATMPHDRHALTAPSQVIKLGPVKPRSYRDRSEPLP